MEIVSLFKNGLRYLTDGGYRFRVNSTHFGMYHDMPDKEYISRLFRIKLGYDMDFESPKTFNQKLQWLKLYDRKPIYTTLVDKYEVKKYVANILGEDYIIPTLGLWNHFDEIDFNSLPNQFVLKCTHDSGGIVICRDKKNLEFNAAKKKIEKCLKKNFYYLGREWPYKNVKPRIIAEKYMKEESGRSLTDYKFFCFNGLPRLLYVSRGLEHHPTAEISFYDMNGNEMSFHRSDYKPYHDAIMPENFFVMKDEATKLAIKIGGPFVRIDLYSIKGKTYFSEITFSPCSGMVPFEPKEADVKLGELLRIPLNTGI